MAVRTLLQKLSRCYPLQIEFVSLFLIFLTFYITFSSYPTLPDKVPTHFNFEGLPDRWGGRSSVFSFPVMNVVFYVLLTLVMVLLVVSKDPRRFINLPRKWKEALTTQAQIEELRLVCCRFLLIVKLLLQGLSLYLAYSAIEVTLGRAKGLGGLMYFFVAVIMVVVGFMLWKSYRISRAR